MGTKNNPGQFDCYAAAEPDEPMFVLLGRDPVAHLVVEFWIALRVEMGADPGTPKIREAMECADKLEEWAKKLGKETEPTKVAFKRAIELLQRALG